VDRGARIQGQRRDRVVAAHALQSSPHRTRQIETALQALANEMSECFRVRVRCKDHALRRQFRAQLRVVLEHTVVHQSHTTMHIRVRVRIHIGGRAVRSPTCVTDACGRLSQRAIGKRGLKVL